MTNNKADKIFRGGTILTMEDDRPQVEAIVIAAPKLKLVNLLKIKSQLTFSTVLLVAGQLGTAIALSKPIIYSLPIRGYNSCVHHFPLPTLPLTPM